MYRIQGLEFKIQDSGLRDQVGHGGCCKANRDVGFRVSGFGISGFSVQGAGCRVQGAGCRVQGAGLTPRV